MSDRYATTAVDLDASQDEDKRDLHAQALADYDAGFLREEQNQLEGLEDLRMLAGEQWDELLKADRTEAGRPSMTENRLPQFVRQITGDLRQMRPAMKAVATNSMGDSDTAEVIEGMIRYIENRSQARAVYFRAADGMVACGRGAFRIETEYASSSTLEQEIRISPIDDGLGVIFDPDAILPDKSDGMFVHVPVDLSRPAFRKRWPDASASDFGDQSARAFTGWYGEDFVRVSEYWYKEEIKRRLLIVDGQVKDLTDEDEETVAEAMRIVELAEQTGRDGIRIEERPGHRVMRAMVSGSEVLEGPTKWPGNYIPIVAMEGEEIRIGRQIMRRGAVRNARDPQRLLNFMVSAYAEAVALQPKAPYIGTERNFEEHESEWLRANSDNLPFLRFTPDPLNGNIAPQRVNPAVASQGFAEGIQLAASAMQATTGIYNSSLGAASNETSGKAITARQREGDTGTFIFTEHFEQALQAAGKIVADLIPHIYDTTREMRIIGRDGAEKVIQINKPVGLAYNGPAPGPGAGAPGFPGDPSAMGAPGMGAGPGAPPALSGPAQAMQRYENDVTVKAYDIVVEMGPSYNTRREEARDGLLAFLGAAPQLAPMMLDLVAKMQDWPLADEVAERIELMLPPQIQAQIAEKRGDPPKPPMPNPQAQAEQAAQQREAELADMKHQVEVGKLQVAASKVQSEGQRTQADLAKSLIEAHTRKHEANAAAVAAHATARGGVEAAQATAAGDAASALAPVPGAEPAEDPRVDQLAGQVAQLQQVVAQLVQALQGGGGVPQPGAAPPGPSPGPQVPPQQPASAGFSMSGIA